MDVVDMDEVGLNVRIKETLISTASGLGIVPCGAELDIVKN